MQVEAVLCLLFLNHETPIRSHQYFSIVYSIRKMVISLYLLLMSQDNKMSRIIRHLYVIHRSTIIAQPKMGQIFSWQIHKLASSDSLLLMPICVHMILACDQWCIVFAMRWELNEEIEAQLTHTCFSQQQYNRPVFLNVAFPLHQKLANLISLPQLTKKLLG